MKPDATAIYYNAEYLHYIAMNLQADAEEWETLDASSRDLDAERIRRGQTLWRHAQQAGVLLFKLCGFGAFNDMPRIKNHICEIRNELRKAIETFEVRPYYFDSRVGYNPPTNDDNYDVFFVNICDGFCRLWANSFEDQNLFTRGGSDFALTAKLYIRILNEASESLQRKFVEGRGPFIQ